MTIQDEPARAMRQCDGCGATDDLPHHQVVVPGDDGALVVTSRHFACCAKSGCPDGSCDAMTGATPGV